MILLAPPSMNDTIRAFVMIRTGLSVPASATQVLGFIDPNKEELVGAFMFERYTGRGGSAYLHWAAADGNRRWLNRTVLALVAHYAFEQLGVTRVFGEVRASDSYVRRIDERLGFKEVAILPGYFPDDDLAVYCITKQECTWLPAENEESSDGQEV